MSEYRTVKNPATFGKITPSDVEEVAKELKRKRSALVISKKAVRDFVKNRGRYITQVDKEFYLVLDFKVRDIILKAISNNCSRKKLTSYEIH